MKKMCKRMTALILAFSMVMSLVCQGAWAEGLREPRWEAPAAAEVGSEPDETDPTTGAEEETQEPETAPVEEETQEPETAPVEEETQEPETAPVEEETQEPEAAPVEEETQEPEAAPVEEETQEPETAPVEEETQESENLPIVEPIHLEYDDHCALDTAFDGKYKGYSIVSMENRSVTSYQVEKGGVKKETKWEDGGTKDYYIQDTAVLKQSGKDGLIAVGTGEADMTLTRGEDTITVTVTVDPAPLTVMYLTGQSNMEGYCAGFSSSKTDDQNALYYHPGDSVLCPTGEVYSTYIPKPFAQCVTGISGYSKSHSSVKGKESYYVAGSLTGTTSVAGSKLAYPVNALTSAGKGKTGMDGALAYEWNRLTGDKVWTINTAVTNTSGASWTVGGTYYERALRTYKAALKTMEAEETAGHYVIRHRLMFWMQGETPDSTQNAESYLKNYAKMLDGFNQAGMNIEKVGIISTRAHGAAHIKIDGTKFKGDDRSEGELCMTIPRMSQYAMAMSKDYPNVYLVSNVHEQWLTESGIQKYFSKAYPNGKLTYPTHSGMTKLPKTLDDLHPDIHFTQTAHNEHGLTAARGMYSLIYGSVTPSSAKWRNADGAAITSLKLAKGEKAVVALETAPLTGAKQVSLEYDKSSLSYNQRTGVLTVLKEGNYTLRAMYNGKPLTVLAVSQPIPDAPTLKSITNTAKGVKFVWNASAYAKGYRVYRKTGSGSYQKIATTTSTSYTDTKAANGTAYTYTVRAYNSLGTSGYKTGKSIIRLTDVTLSSVKNSQKKSLAVKWKKNAKATGYQVQYSLKSSFASPVTKTYKGTAVSKTVTGLTKGKTYYVRVRAYRTASGVTSYSAWSGSKKVAVKK